MYALQFPDVDVPVKLFSFHLIAMSLFLLAPEMKRLLNVLVLNRPAGPSAVPSLGGSRRAVWIGMVAQLVFGTYLIGMNLNGSVNAWTTYGGGAPVSPLYGVWNVDHMTIDGVERAPLVTDYNRWRRVVFDSPTSAAFQRMDDTFARYGAKIDQGTGRMTLTRAGTAPSKGQFSFERPEEKRMTLRGEIDGKKIEMRLGLFPRDNFLLTTRGFNWIQEQPFNR